MTQENLHNFKRYGTLTEEKALNLVNSTESITKSQMEDILLSLGDATNDYVMDLDERVIGSYSYYEGLFKGMDIALRLLNKLELVEN